jgi:hypothetical protein
MDLIFMGRNLEDRKKVTLVQIMNSACLSSKNIMNNVGIFNGSTTTNSIFSELYLDE